MGYLCLGSLLNDLAEARESAAGRWFTFCFARAPITACRGCATIASTAARDCCSNCEAWVEIAQAECAEKKERLDVFRQNLNRYDAFTKNSRPSLMN